MPHSLETYWHVKLRTPTSIGITAYLTDHVEFADGWIRFRPSGASWAAHGQAGVGPMDPGYDVTLRVPESNVESITEPLPS